MNQAGPRVAPDRRPDEADAHTGPESAGVLKLRLRPGVVIPSPSHG